MDDHGATAPDVKRHLRAAIRAARRQQSDTADSLAARGARLASTVLSDPEVAAACARGAVVTCYASMTTEPPTDALLDRLSEAGATVLLPVIRGERQMHWTRYEGPLSLTHTSAAPSLGSIREPVGEPVATTPLELIALSPAVLLLPALAVDESGARLGQGGGYYDTLLAELPDFAHGGPLRIALVGPGEVLEGGTIPTQPHDQQVDRWLVG